MAIYPKKCCFLKKDWGYQPQIMFCGDKVERVTVHRHLGLYLTPILDWSVHVHQVCLRANRKLAVLRNIKLLNRSTLDLLYKLLVQSIIDYAMPVYFGNLKQTDINRLEQIQCQAAKLVTGALHQTSKIKLNIELGWKSLQVRYECLGLSVIHKIHLGQTAHLSENSCLHFRLNNIILVSQANINHFPM